jgi:hypothetical protein
MRALNTLMETHGQLVRMQYFTAGVNATWQDQRNQLVRQTRNKYKLFIDCESEFTDDTKLEPMADILDRHPTIGLVLGLDSDEIETDEDDKENDDGQVWYRLVRLASLPSKFMLCHVDIFLGGGFKTGDEKMSSLAQSLQSRVAFASALLPNVKIKQQSQDETETSSGEGSGSAPESNLQSGDGGEQPNTPGVHGGENKTAQHQNTTRGPRGGGAGPVRGQGHK